MAQHQSAKKRVRSSARRRDRNKTYRTRMKGSIKKVLASTKKEAGTVALKEAQSVIDTLVSRGIIHKNKGSNKKSSLSRYVNTLK
jgi:small subunit ribosomal protein S20